MTLSERQQRRLRYVDANGVLLSYFVTQVRLDFGLAEFQRDLEKIVESERFWRESIAFWTEHFDPDKIERARHHLRALRRKRRAVLYAMNLQRAHGRA